MFFQIENILQKRKIVFLIFFFAILLQFIYGFIFPSYDPASDYWKNVEELGSYKDYSYDSFSGSAVAKLYPLVSNYKINLDSAAYILLAHDFPSVYFRGVHTFLNRPLYSFLVFLIASPLRLINNSYIFTFTVGLIINIILFFLAAVLLYSLTKELISGRVAFFSSFLLIFSSFSRVWLTQPSAQIFGVFSVVLTLYLFYNYLCRPSFKKLIIFSLIGGTLMLGKMLFALPFFVFISAIFFKRYKEAVLFALIFLMPLVFWYIIVAKIWGLPYYSQEMTDFNMFLINGWFFNIFNLPWQETFRIFLDSLPSFIFSLIYGFLFLPVVFAVIGFKKLSFKEKNFFCGAFIFSFFLLFFVMNYYNPGHAFLLFPLIYPLAVLGIDRLADLLKKISYSYDKVFYLLIYLFLIVISNIDIFKIFKADIGSPWLK